MKCDIIIPIYNSLNWVKMCITAVYENTNACDIGEVILINDKSDKETTLYLRKISKQYFNIRLIENKKNLGFVKSCNYGMSIAKSDYILLLNSDCLLSKDAVGKMMRAMQKDKKIGLLCPSVRWTPGRCSSPSGSHRWITLSSAAEHRRRF